MKRKSALLILPLLFTSCMPMHSGTVVDRNHRDLQRLNAGRSMRQPDLWRLLVDTEGHEANARRGWVRVGKSEYDAAKIGSKWQHPSKSSE